ncbi:MAG: hypothetical protein AAFQ80_02555 [Cyanobacteria bacterium J06621_8]
MNDLPITNNVYGFLYSKVGLRDVAKVLQDFLELSEKQAYIYKSQFDGNETLKIRTEAYEFETQSLEEEDKWLFNGAVAGDIDSIKVILKEICDTLKIKGYEANFEIYDENCEFISEYP